jgi:D-apionolactonase
MEGDAFEMEDHRNWMDASYKTYVRPLAKPWPYTISKGALPPQKVTLAVQGEPPRRAAPAGGAVTVRIGGPTGTVVPRLGLAVPAEHAEAALDAADLLSRLGPGFLVCHFDARKGHGAAEMQRFAGLGEAVGAELVLEAVVPCLDASGNPSADPAILERDMAAIRDAAAGVRFDRVAVSPATDLKCTLPGSVFPPAPSWDELLRAARAAFPGVPVGGGMFSYFTELNRKRPPAELLDFLCHSGCPIVHAGDDLSVMENLEALPSIFRTVRSFAGEKPYWVFPTAISMRDNPYGAVPAENPGNIRQAMNRVDPRDRALLGAAWYAGYMARAARAGVEAVTLAAAAGPSGIAYLRQAHAQPWFDEVRPAAMPSFQAVAAFCPLQGAALLQTEVDSGAQVQALAAEGPQGRTLVLANLTATEQQLHIEGVSGPVRARVLDETTFEEACTSPFSVTDHGVDSGELTLSAYALAVLVQD